MSGPCRGISATVKSMSYITVLQRRAMLYYCWTVSVDSWSVGCSALFQMHFLSVLGTNDCKGQTSSVWGERLCLIFLSASCIDYWQYCKHTRYNLKNKKKKTSQHWLFLQLAYQLVPRLQYKQTNERGARCSVHQLLWATGSLIDELMSVM